jgi:DNA topoisomerase VI subunit B
VEETEAPTIPFPGVGKEDIDKARAGAEQAEKQYMEKCAKELQAFLQERELTLSTIQQVILLDGKPQYGPVQIQLGRVQRQQPPQ